jgi:hypothetical protein
MGIDTPTSSHFSRRELLAGAGSSLLLAASPMGANASAAKRHPAPTEADGKLFDLLIKGGKVIDSSQELEEVCDVALRDGRIARLEHDIPEDMARQVVDATGKIVTPGLIDIHTHVFPYVGPYGIEPDPYCVTRGVTTALDAGTSGAFTFPLFESSSSPRRPPGFEPCSTLLASVWLRGARPTWENWKTSATAIRNSPSKSRRRIATSSWVSRFAFPKNTRGRTTWRA